MAFEVKVLFSGFIALLVFSSRQLVYGDPQVPCYFIFGDSLMDNGNNNGLVTTAKANFAPYGIDFPEGPTGRFSNGQNIADVIAELLGFESYIPPFVTASGKEILRGVNYGSGGAGIRDETGQHLGDRISLNKQLHNHENTISRLAVLLGNRRLAKQYLSKCIYTVGMGNNDYINNYFLPQFYLTSRLYTPELYAGALVRQYSRQLKTLYKNGAKKVGVFAPGYCGCTPAEMAIYGTNGSSCVEIINNAIILFNDGLKNLLDDLNNNLPDAKYIFIKASVSYDGMTVTDRPCCKVSNTIGKGQCAPNEVPCKNRTEYVFWDGFHPTASATLVDGVNAYRALSPFYNATVDIRGVGDEFISSI